MIPKIIHYVWVGNNEKSNLVLKCIESWKKYCPDYEIREWNNKDLTKINNVYCKEAFQCKKWAFVSDYLRLYALNLYGGFYFDTDLELTAPIDNFRKHAFVTGYENWEGHISPVTACMGADKGNKIIHDLLKEYNGIHFLENGKMDQTTNVVRISKYFANTFLLKAPYDGLDITSLSQNECIYPYFYFCTPKKGEINYSIHHFNGSWVDPEIFRKEKMRIGIFKIVRFKRKNDRENNKLPIKDDEKVIFSLKMSECKVICLIKEEK